MGCATSSDTSAACAATTSAPSSEAPRTTSTLLVASQPFHPDPLLEDAGAVTAPTAAKQHSAPSWAVTVPTAAATLPTDSDPPSAHRHQPVVATTSAENPFDFRAFEGFGTDGSGEQSCVLAYDELSDIAAFRGDSPALTMDELPGDTHLQRIEGRGNMARMHGYTADIHQFPAAGSLPRRLQRATERRCRRWLAATHDPNDGDNPSPSAAPLRSVPGRYTATAETFRGTIPL